MIELAIKNTGKRGVMTGQYPIDGSRDALWMATAVAAPNTEMLTGEITVDVAIIGGGFTGLNAALHLAESGTSVAVLEAANLGFGASGRSGGQVNLGLNLGPKDLIDLYGPGPGEHLVEAIVKAPDDVFELIRRHQLDCDPVRNGWVQGAVTSRQLKVQEKLAKDYADFGVQFECLDRQGIYDRSGARGFEGGLFCPPAGSLHPLSYTRELARTALEQGARIFTQAKVDTLQKDGPHWLLTTNGGRVKASTVLVCTNAYSDDLIDGLRETVVPVRSILMATEPLSADLRRAVMPDQVTFVDKRRLILYLRYDRDGRLCAGDHGPMRDHFAHSDYVRLKKRVVDIFPDLASVKWDFHWGGRVAMTRSTLPFLQVIEPGLIVGMGYNGRGVGMGSVMGRTLAEFALGKPETTLPFPLTCPKKFPLHQFHRLGVAMGIKWHGMLDFLETRRSAY